jgi:hypothetical protein
MFALVGCLLVGCTALPNTSGYTAATIQVKQAVATTGSVVEAELASAISAGATTASATRVERFKQYWKQTVASLDAMVAYAQSIEQIVDAGNKGAESAKQVAESVRSLVDAVKVDAKTGAAAKVVELSTQTFAFVYGEYAKFLAAKSLEEALDRVGPSIARVSTLVQAQIADADRLFAEQIGAQALELKGDYGDWIKQGDRLKAMQQTAATRLLGLIEPVSPSDKDHMTEAVKKIEGSGWDNMTARQREARVEQYRNEQIKQLETAISQMETTGKQIAPHLEEYKAQLSQIRQREKAGRSIISASENAVAAWSTSHQELVQAVKERKPVSVESLTAAVVEIRTLIRKWSEL